MGKIHDDVKGEYLARFPEEEEFLKPFLCDFDITWARKRRRAYNTEMSVYFLKPLESISESYGFSKEILLGYSKYATVESRTIQAMEQILNDEPAKGRVEKLNYFLISKMENIKSWIENYILENPESRIIVPFSEKALVENKTNKWYVKNILNDQLFSRDLFDYRLPLEKDTYYFGRKELAGKCLDSVRRSENLGLFGLRKTGKTSLLFKLERLIRFDDIGKVVFIDCKNPSIRKSRWNELIERICLKTIKKFKIKIKNPGFEELNCSDTFSQIMMKIPRNKKAVFVFDEIEFISPVSRSDPHWKKDFIDFWQTFWAYQSRKRNVVALIAGVNPWVVENDSFEGTQNPLFGIITPYYMKGFDSDEVKDMVVTLGTKMGLKLDQAGLDYLHSRYGGHPLLTRIACSLINANLQQKKVEKPVTLDLGEIKKEEAFRDSEIQFYCRHVVSELKQFYPEEYEMLEYLASGQLEDFLELSTGKEFTKHLESYGLLTYDNKMPTVTIPTIKRYVGLELARRENRKTIYKIIPSNRRENWIGKRVSTIKSDMRLLETLISTNKRPLLFGPNSFPNADSLDKIKVCQSEQDFENFITICNKCFVESIKNFWQSKKTPNYFLVEIKAEYPDLDKALRRIKIYRHDRVHLKLDKKASRDLLEILKADLEGKKPSEVDDLWFHLQQCVLDGLFAGIQAEINNLD